MMAASLLLAALVAAGPPAAAAPRAAYEAGGAEPFWNLEVDGNRATLSSSLHEGRLVWTVQRRRASGAPRWEGSGQAGRIRIVARAAPCTTEADETYEHEVTVRYRDIVLNGCGGRLLRAGEETGQPDS